MKLNRLVVELTVSALVGLAATSAFAQASDSPSTEMAASTLVPASTSKSTSKQAKAANRALQKDVVRALSKAKGLRSSAITVRANNGMVTLEGTVPEAAQIDQAVHVAEAVAGVKSVKNALTLSVL